MRFPVTWRTAPASAVFHSAVSSGKENAVTMPDSSAYEERRSVSELFGELTQDLALLVRQETQLARTEIETKIARLTQDLISLAAGGMVLLIGALALTAALVLLLVDPVGLAPWLAALLVGVAFAGGGALLLRRGLRDLKRIDPTPRRTVESIKEDIQMAREVRQ